MTRLLRHQQLPHLILVVGIALSIAAWYFTGRLAGREARADFDAQADAAVSSIERQMQRYIDLLHGLGGLFAYDAAVSRTDFSRYVGALQLADRFPGVQAVQFIRRVSEAERTAFEASVRNDRSVDAAGYPGFTIKPSGNRPEYYVVHYIEPMRGNEAVLGLDLLSRDGPGKASQRARDTGKPILTGRYRLVQETPTQSGLVMYLAVYKVHSRDRAAERRPRDLAGFVNVVFRTEDLFANLATSLRRDNLIFQVHDAGSTDADPLVATNDNLLYSIGTTQNSATGSRPNDEVVRRFDVAGRHWLIRFAGPSDDGSPFWQTVPLLILAGALVITMLLFLTLRTLSRSREDAMRMADSATRELRDQLSFSRQLLEAIPNPVFYKDAHGRYLGCNQAFEEFSNRPRSEYIGKTVLEVTTSEAAQTHHRIETELLQTKGSTTYELSLTRSTDGRQMDAVYKRATFVDADGKVAGLVGVVNDITERKTLERTLSQSNETLRSIIEASPLAIIARDLEAVIQLWNPAAEKLFGWKAEEVVGTSQSIVPEDIRTDVAAMRRQVERGMMFSQEETRRMHKDGTVIDITLSVAPIRDARQNTVGTMVLIGDISGRKRTEAALRESETQLRLALDAANMASWYWDLEAGRFSCSDGFRPLFGLPRATLFTDYADFSAAIHPEDRAQTDAAIKRAIKHDVNFDMECRTIWPDQSEHWLAVKGQVSRDETGRALRMIGVTNDITIRKLAEQRIAYMAHHDALTGLPNRVLLEDRIGQAVALSHRNGTRVAVLFIDLDHFKTINDSLGHQVGDQLLQLVASRIQSCLREVDTVSRLGGDEFVIVIPELNANSDVSSVATKLLEVLGAHFHLQVHDLHVSASIGISIYPTDGETAEILMRNADTAMYAAKERGRSQYQFFTRDMNAAAQQRMSLQTALRRSLQSNDFSLHYQPVFSTARQTLTGFEALLRWNNPSGVLVYPAEFISVAEDSGLIVPIGEWVIGEACRTAAAWHRRGHRLKIAINVSAVQLRRKSFAQVIAATLAATGIDPHLIEIEITERVIVGGHEEAITSLREIDALGIQIAIDDFGTGYSGLSYLKQFPIDTVKIDQSFVRDLTVDTDDEAIVRAIIAMSQSLKLKVVAEGVETLVQLDLLKALGCDMVQGYYLGKPLRGEEVDAFIDASTAGLAV